MSDSAYGTKVMLGSIDKLICDALQEIAPGESTTVEAYEKATTPTRGLFRVRAIRFPYLA